jgi:GTPase
VAKTEEPPKAVRRFEGQILVLYHNTTIQPRYQAVLHCGSIRQTVRIVSIEGAEGRVLRTGMMTFLDLGCSRAFAMLTLLHSPPCCLGDRASVLFEFVGAPEYVKVGMKLLFREGKTKGLGVVSRVGV